MPKTHVPKKPKKPVVGSLKLVASSNLHTLHIEQLLDIYWAAYANAMQSSEEEKYEVQNALLDGMNEWCEGNLLDTPRAEKEVMYLMDATLTGLRYDNW